MDCFFLTFVLQTDFILFRTNVDLIMIVTAAAALTDELLSANNAGTDVNCC